MSCSRWHACSHRNRRQALKKGSRAGLRSRPPQQGAAAPLRCPQPTCPKGTRNSWLSSNPSRWDRSSRMIRSGRVGSYIFLPVHLRELLLERLFGLGRGRLGLRLVLWLALRHKLATPRVKVVRVLAGSLVVAEPMGHGAHARGSERTGFSSSSSSSSSQSPLGFAASFGASTSGSKSSASQSLSLSSARGAMYGQVTPQARWY